MTVATTAQKVQYSGNGSATEFPVTFPYDSISEIEVILSSSAGVDTVKTITTHYTLTAPGSSGTLTMLTAPAVGEVLTIRGNSDVLQSLDATVGGGFSASVVEAAFDKLTILAQQILERISRAPKLRKGSTAAEVTLPDPGAGKLIRWNSGGTDLENVAAADIDLAVVSPFIETLVDDLDAAAARATLGAVGGSTGGTDNRLLRASGTGGATLDASPVSADDSGNVSGVANLALTGYLDATEIAAPSNPSANVARAYAADSAGTTTLTMRDSAGNLAPLSHFLQPLTGATVRTQHAKLAERRSVKDFGAVGDGTTNDTAAIQAALDAGRGEVFFPCGTYMAQALSWPSEVSIRGENSVKTVLKLRNSANTYLLASKRYVDNSADLFPDGQNEISYITLDGNKANNTSGSCLILRSYNAQIFRCNFQNAADHGIIQACATANGSNPQNAAECVYRENRISDNEKHGMWFKDDSNGNIADAWIVDNWIHSNGTDDYVQVNIERGAGFHIHSNQIYSDYNGNIKISGASGTAFTGNNLELNTLKGGTGATYRNMEVALGDGGGANLGINIQGNFFHTFLSDVATNTYKHLDFTGSGDAAVIDGNVFRAPSGGWTNGAAIDRTAGSAITGAIGSNNFFQNFTGAQRGQGYFDLCRQVIITSASGVTAQTLASVQADAAAGPIIDLDRQSPSPAASDNLGMVRFRGRDNAGGTDDYAYMVALIDDATSGSEDGTLDIYTRRAGADVLSARFGGVGIRLGTVGIVAGTGAPSFAAAKGTLYIRTDATTTTTRLYINTDGSTTWANFTASA